MTVQADMIREAKALEGIKYKDKGRDVIGGLDCAGVLVTVAHRLGLSDYDSLDYSRRPNAVELKRELDRIAQLEMIPNKWDWQSGDIGLFSTDSHPVHLGFLERDEMGREFVIHAWAPARKVVRSEVTRDDLQNNPKLKLRRVYRYKG